MNDFRHLYYLTRIDGLGAVRIRRLIDKFSSAQKVFEADIASLAEVENISVKIASSITKSINNFSSYSKDYDETIKKLEKHNAGVLTYEDESYPVVLKKTYDPPVILYTKGILPGEFLSGPSVAIVGTRKPSDYGRRMAEILASELSNMGINIISGFARGVDSIAHKAVLDCPESTGKTAAVFGCGVDFIYPPENKKLYERICSDGLILSEYEISAIPDAANFPRRNRIISGLSYGTVIIESTCTGGAMLTARFALDQSREVFAVPGFVTSKNSEGPNFLIKSGQAKLVENVDDILVEIGNEISGLNLNGMPQRVQKKIPELIGNEKLIFDTISSFNDAVHIDAIAESSGLNISDCLVTLLNLEFKGLMEQLPGKRFKAC